jgi:DNA-binding CsgD family transcriptional regulator
MEVLWINEPGRAAVASHPELLIGPARLRVRNRDSDADLRAAVDWAHTLKIASPRKKLAAMARLRTVRLGETDEGAPLFCWVFIEDGEVLITFDVPEAAERRLNYARSVFSLSPAQLRLANELVAGHRLTEAARNLDVSVTTLRTQLRRMFDKTGQRTQAGLVRALLSLHVPTKV